MSTDPIFFYGHNNEYGEFSNFYPALFRLDGLQWPTSEHYFMAQKTLDADEQEAIRRAERPHDAKAMGRKVQLRAGWDGMKYDLMQKAVYAKFDQNERLRFLLLETGDRPLHENCRDPWWGGGPNYPKGRDWLGRILMAVRTELREKYGEPDPHALRDIVAGLRD